MLKNILNPTASDAFTFIEKYHKSKPDKTMLLLVGDCMVDYRGRARSFLDWGERIIMIKDAGIWDKVSDLDVYMLIRKVKDRDLPPDLIEQIQKFQSIEKSERIYLSKIKSREE